MANITPITTTSQFKAKMREKKFTGQTLAPLLGLSPQSLSQRKRGTVPFTLDEAFKILEIFEVEPCEIARFFVGRLKG